MRLGAALTGHWLELDAIRRLARRADELGYAVLLVDGDTGVLPRRPSARVYGTSVLSSAALQATRHTRVGAFRLPAFWNAALLARDLTSLQDASGGRALACLGVGAERHEGRFGLPQRRASQRVAHLEELLDALRALLAGEEVTRRGRFVALDQARLAPPRDPLPLVVAAARPRALALAERYADVLDANVPPLPEHLAELRARLSRKLELWLWIFARPGASLESAAKDYRQHCPWFDVPEKRLPEALLFGDASRCRERLAEMREKLEVDVPILDLSGLDEEAARRALEIFAPADARDIS